MPQKDVFQTLGIQREQLNELPSDVRRMLLAYSDATRNLIQDQGVPVADLEALGQLPTSNVGQPLDVLLHNHTAVATLAGAGIRFHEMLLPLTQQQGGGDCFAAIIRNPRAVAALVARDDVTFEKIKDLGIANYDGLLGMLQNHEQAIALMDQGVPFADLEALGQLPTSSFGQPLNVLLQNYTAVATLADAGIRFHEMLLPLTQEQGGGNCFAAIIQNPRAVAALVARDDVTFEKIKELGIENYGCLLGMLQNHEQAIALMDRGVTFADLTSLPSITANSLSSIEQQTPAAHSSSDISRWR